MPVLLRTLLVTAALFSTHAIAHEITAGDLHIQHPWSRALPPVATTGAAYMVIQNQGAESDTLLGASTPIAEDVQLHEHVHHDDVMTMQRVDSIELAPGEQVEFAPGGYHVMLFGLQQPLVAGHTYPMTLKFAQAGDVNVEVHISGDEAVKPAEHGHSHHH